MMALEPRKLRHIAFQGYDQVVPLSGFSGAEIALLKSPSGSYFVRKVSSTTSGNEALRVQATRQSSLRKILVDVAQMPEVLNEGMVGDYYFFDMEFVPSRDANSFLIEAPFRDIHRFAEGVSNILRQLSESPNEMAQKPEYEALRKKLKEIQLRTGGIYETHLGALEELFDQLEQADALGGATLTHGDLTFENILIDSQDRFWLIDSIPPPIEHYWLD